MQVKKVFAVLLLLVVALSIQMTMAQQMPTIPVDTAVRIGKLDCGLTYYIRYNGYPEHRVNFYIAQRVGSIQEEESQRGLAHFLEHMAFNGSEHFHGEGNGIIDYTRSLGVAYGEDLNAYTDITETVYNINDVPSTRQSAIDSCLLILKDWSGGLLLEDEKIDKERGVIHEEWRSDQDPDNRMIERQLENLYPGSKYGRRSPIGLMDVIDNFKYQELRDYYHKWYRPDNQALVIVGDVDVDHIEAQIKELFKDCVLDPNAVQVTSEPVADNEEPIIVIDQDKEKQYSDVSVIFKHEPYLEEGKGNMEHLVYCYIDSIASQMLNERLMEMAQEPDCPFVQAYCYDTDYIYSKTMAAFTMDATPKEGKAEETVQALITEALRAVKHGFTETEYSRAREEYMSMIEDMYNDNNTMHNEVYGRACCRNFLNNEPIISEEMNYSLMSMISSHIDVEMINSLLPEMIETDGRNMVIVNFNQEKEGAVYPTVEGFKNAIAAANSADITPYVDNVKNEPLITKMPKAGKIVKESYNVTFGYKELELSNGSRAIIKQTDFRDDEIIMIATQRGGSSLYGEEDWANCEMFDYAIESSGLGGFNNIELSKALAGKRVSLSQSLSTYEDYVTGSSSVKDLETLFQLIYLQFTDVTRDDKSYNNLVNQMEISLKNKDIDPENVFNDSLQYIMDNHSWRSKPYKLEDMRKLSYDRILEIAKERNANAAGYDFIFVGTFDEVIIRQLIELYIASLPGNKGKKSNWKYDVDMPTGETICHFTQKMEVPKADEVVIWHNNTIPYTLENSIKATILGEVLTKIYDLKIREEAGATYTAYAYGTNSRSGDLTETMVLAVSPVKPEFRDEALKIIKDEMVNACSNIDASTLKDIKENMLKEHATYLKENGYWLGIIQDYLLYGNDSLSAYEEIVKAQTPETIAAFARQLMAAGNRIEVVMSPEQ